jgi:hypothetical protein
LRDKRTTSGWECPRCARRFAKRNQQHACANDWTEERHLRDRPRAVIQSYRRFLSLARKNGRIELTHTKSYIGVRGPRRNFAGLIPTNKGLEGFIVAARRIEGPPLLDALPYQRNLFIHHFFVGAPPVLDEDFAGWISESYAVGEGRHLDQSE